jgi:hypothetical protein
MNVKKNVTEMGVIINGDYCMWDYNGLNVKFKFDFPFTWLFYINRT